MTTTTLTDRTADELAERVFGSVLGALDIFAIYLGDRLGYYKALVDFGPLTPGQLAKRTGTNERYAREWLQQQTVTDIVDMAYEAGEHLYSLSAGFAEALTDRLSLSYVAPFARMIAAAGLKLGSVAEAHRTGKGVSWDEFGDDMRESQGDMNRPFFVNLLASEWFGSVPELDQILQAGARVADVGMGHGWSSIALAKGYPGVTVDGYDLDEPSVASANQHAEEEGVSDRVSFHAIDAGDPSVDGQYDLVTAFECIHDLPDPVSTLRTMRRIAKEGGAVVVMDEKVSETFTGDADEIEKLMYGFSNFICLPDGMAHEGSVGTGTVMRPETLRRYATEAGFSDIEVLPIEADLWRFYKLV